VGGVAQLLGVVRMNVRDAQLGERLREWLGEVDRGACAGARLLGEGAHARCEAAAERGAGPGRARARAATAGRGVGCALQGGPA
jgi:hypothetical protein